MSIGSKGLWEQNIVEEYIFQLYRATDNAVCNDRLVEIAAKQYNSSF